ncbi:dynein light chain, Tctex-1 domain containing protein [Monocercomonoides exilis]|uniref:dynein light chain, Tctex-1 domain containing protein n=1 Tax=Monocercomonoides exilis TaxID=2049356 RepID=UPI0035599F5B|nr:dynein light chain, Tctex-1 domain containing protein [Monocercomonoides exilis]|eukprot:MONOS_5552.1-p1 / transcript=MONOS_5552.1 / gene=MONOS_5552 / organism=Monocercomonoides_exilis_PA203 / gene_product=dynein light chain, Tctex-1 domain containing protein / transcript_product=dynein light chain, Tctex-1 domain containing protein / location=Mono_scaffold00163:29642-30162(-) / protein_length=128 / sequence_SO=supercontig / SO=protein_coding / is_pseudo=false
MMEEEGRTVLVENTYQLGPLKKEKVSFEKIQKIAEDVLESVLKDATYDAAMAPKVSKNISQEILTQISELHYTRYKFACQVTLGEIKDQGVRISSRCLWDPTYDICVSAKYQKNQLFASALIFCIYFL